MIGFLCWRGTVSEKYFNCFVNVAPISLQNHHWCGSYIGWWFVFSVPMSAKLMLGQTLMVHLIAFFTMCGITWQVTGYPVVSLWVSTADDLPNLDVFAYLQAVRPRYVPPSNLCIFCQRL